MSRRVTHEIKLSKATGNEMPLCYPENRHWRSFTYSLVLAPTCKRCIHILERKGKRND